MITAFLVSFGVIFVAELGDEPGLHGARVRDPLPDGAPS